MDPVVITTIITILVPIAYILGVAAAILVPYLNAKKENPDIVFDWNYVTWQIVSAFVGLIPTILTAEFIKQLDNYAAMGWIGIVLAAGAGFGIARGGREFQKARK